MAIAIRERREVGRVEAVVERPDGERRYVLAHPRLTRDGNGVITGAVNVVVDITDRRRAEDQLRLNDRRKDAFISTVAHELRSPLSPIMSAAQLIDTTDNPATMKRMAGVITRQARMLGRLVNDLFDASAHYPRRAAAAQDPPAVRQRAAGGARCTAAIGGGAAPASDRQRPGGHSAGGMR